MDMKPELVRKQRLSAERTALVLSELKYPVVGNQVRRASSAHLPDF